VSDLVSDCVRGATVVYEYQSFVVSCLSFE